MTNNLTLHKSAPAYSDPDQSFWNKQDTNYSSLIWKYNQIRKKLALKLNALNNMSCKALGVKLALMYAPRFSRGPAHTLITAHSLHPALQYNTADPY